MQLLVLVAFVVLTSQLWRLQILQTEGYQQRADVNRFRLVSIDAPRGVMYDRDGRLLVRNVPTYCVSVVPGALPEGEASREAVLSRLSELLGIPVSSRTASTSAVPARPGIEEILERDTISPYAPVAISEDVDKQVAFLIEEEHQYLPGVVVELAARREYTTGILTSNVVGYVSGMPAELVDHFLDQVSGDYDVSDAVGLMGLEAAYEQELRGRKGTKHVEVDAFEREVNVLATNPPQPGHSLLLTLDVDLQQAAEAALREGMRRVDSTSGVVVAMDPRNGAILAMVSLPSYDNNLFARGISTQEYEQLSQDPEHPLINHAVSGQYPPGSTFKIIPAAAALEEGVVNLDTHVRCKGEMLLPNKFFPNDPDKAQAFVCWNEWGHGSLNVIDGIAHSCDIFFYHVGGGFEDFSGLGLDTMNEYARAFGLGEPTGIALPGESPGLVADDHWKRVNYGEHWVTGDTYNAVIGQGFVLVTPLQLLNATAAVANGGTLYRPQLVQLLLDSKANVVRDPPPEVIREIPVSVDNIERVREGMRAAVTRGTAHRINLAEIEVAGKTGTAEYPGPRDEEGYLPTHAWFTTFAPYDEPEIAMVVFVSGGHEGAKVAVPIAARIMRAHFGLEQLADEDIVAPPPGD
jgi:penicillin-binding protein 2